MSRALKILMLYIKSLTLLNKLNIYDYRKIKENYEIPIFFYTSYYCIKLVRYGNQYSTQIRSTITSSSGTQ